MVDYLQQYKKQNENANIQLFAKGKTRKVYSIDNKYCIKIPQNRDGLFQNRREIHNWKNLSEIGNFLMPVINYSENGKWLKMKKGEKYNNKNRFREFKRKIKQEKPDYIKLDDLELKNTILCNNKIKICDYARFHKLI